MADEQRTGGGGRPRQLLCEGGAGETVRRRLMPECDVHTLLRLPSGVFYAQGGKVARTSLPQEGQVIISQR